MIQTIGPARPLVDIHTDVSHGLAHIKIVKGIHHVQMETNLFAHGNDCGQVIFEAVRPRCNDANAPQKLQLAKALPGIVLQNTGGEIHRHINEFGQIVLASSGAKWSLIFDAQGKGCGSRVFLRQAAPLPDPALLQPAPDLLPAVQLQNKAVPIYHHIGKWADGPVVDAVDETVGISVELFGILFDGEELLFPTEIRGRNIWNHGPLLAVAPGVPQRRILE